MTRVDIELGILEFRQEAIHLLVSAITHPD